MVEMAYLGELQRRIVRVASLVRFAVMMVVRDQIFAFFAVSVLPDRILDNPELGAGEPKRCSSGPKLVALGHALSVMTGLGHGRDMGRLDTGQLVGMMAVEEAIQAMEMARHETG